MNTNNEDEEEKFSEDPDEQMRIENELLKLKMSAQFGGDFMAGDNGDLPPEIMNQFLNHIMSFEQSAADANGKTISVFDKIGRPLFKPASELSKNELTEQLERANKMLNEHKMELDICDGPYEDEVIYTFITQELFAHEVDDMHGFEGICHFIYEEFHPNHKADIKKTVKNFFNNFFRKSFNEYSSELGNHFTPKDGRVMTKEAVIQYFQTIFQSFSSFDNVSVKGGDFHFELDNNEGGKATASGAIKFDAILENNEIMNFSDHFMFEMDYRYNMWEIVYFEIPCFDWDAVKE
jgi:hypothetical protein